MAREAKIYKMTVPVTVEVLVIQETDKLVNFEESVDMAIKTMAKQIKTEGFDNEYNSRLVISSSERSISLFDPKVGEASYVEINRKSDSEKS
ncbi:hypothetical protein [Yersinia ruckeri]|uniref:hypothetical protein n=1 Tax=Yersinia ruckeri TaxID=29486 RepID=UPI0022377A81|nr:hypothetical protein [Yersinia ruckeri]MCW6598766.1 hypothetical protein [Yersinia ruckeri]